MARHDADSHKLTIPGSIGLSDGNMRNVLLLELLFESKKLKLAARTKGNRSCIRRKVARAALACGVNQLGAEVTDGSIEATNAVVVEAILDGNDRRIVWTCRQPRRLRGTRSVKLGKTSWK